MGAYVHSIRLITQQCYSVVKLLLGNCGFSDLHELLFGIIMCIVWVANKQTHVNNEHKDYMSAICKLALPPPPPSMNALCLG